MFDFPTMLAVTMFISAVAGILLLSAWLQNRSINALGVPGWWLAGRTERMDITEGSLRAYEALVRLWRPIEDALRPPVGLSLVARATKPA